MHASGGDFLMWSFRMRIPITLSMFLVVRMAGAGEPIDALREKGFRVNAVSPTLSVLHQPISRPVGSSERFFDAVERAIGWQHLGHAGIRLTAFPDRGEEFPVLQLNAIHRHVDL